MFIPHDIDFEKYHHVDISNGKIVLHGEITFVLTVDTDVTDFLPGKTYNPDDDNSPKVVFIDGVDEWLAENIIGKRYFSLSDAWFENAEDALAFKLRWS